MRVPSYYFLVLKRLLALRFRIGGVRRRYGIDDTAGPPEKFVSVRNFVSFTWTVVWHGGSHTTLYRLRVHDALLKNCRIPLPPGWEVALNLLKSVDNTRIISQRSLPLNVCQLDCKLLGIPKRLALPQNDRSPGACVALVDNGRRVNYVLVAHILGDVWRCSPGAQMQNGCILLDTVWRPEDCKTKNIVEDAWSGMVVKRRINSHVMIGQLQQLLLEHGDSFSDLVANQVWVVENDRTCKTNHTLDVNAVSACFESDPFIWDQVAGHTHHSKAYFIWSWQYKGELQYSKEDIALSNITCGDIPLPKVLFTDLALFERLLRRAKRETEQTFCTCTYLGAQVGPNKFEQDPSWWHGDGLKSNQRVWIEYKHVRNLETNKVHRVQVIAKNWLNRDDRTPGNPLYTTSSRTLRFSVQFMDAFAQNRLDGMTFLGVCYDNPERPEITRHLPNDIDIQNEQFWWQLPSGETTCKSLIELRDGTLDMMLPEDSAEAYEHVCSQLGYVALGVPKTEADVLKFEEYRRSGDQGYIIVASVPHALCYPYGVPLAHTHTQTYSSVNTCPRSVLNQLRKGTLYRSDDIERRWKKEIEWITPTSESSKCWFVTNAGVADKEVEPKFLHRSLATLKVYLKNTRVATTKRIKDEYERRKTNNREAVEVLQSTQMWNMVHGPCPEYLVEPTDEALDLAHEAKDLLLKIRAQEDAPDNAPQIANDLIKAVNTLGSLDFERIRKEKFPMTPEMLFEGLVKNMKELHSERKLAAEDSRRRKWLSAGLGEEGGCEGSIANLGRNGADRFGCDPDAFSRPNSRQKPKGFANAVLKASLIHIDEMRTLLEMHYDDVHIAKHLRRIQGRNGEERVVTKRRKSDYKVFRSVVNSHKRRLCQRIHLPEQVVLARKLLRFLLNVYMCVCLCRVGELFP